ncbi:MAG: hypothetical protein ABIP56_03555 [Dokdonella sp.]
MASLKNVIRSGVDDAEETLSDFADASRRRARRAGKQIQSGASAGQDLASEFFADVTATARNAGQLVRERPIASAAAMIVGGLLIGAVFAFMRRR